MQYKEAEIIVFDYEALDQARKEADRALPDARQRADEALIEVMGKPYHEMTDQDWREFYVCTQDEEVFGTLTEAMASIELDMDLSDPIASSDDDINAVCEACGGCSYPNVSRETCEFRDGKMQEGHKAYRQ